MKPIAGRIHITAGCGDLDKTDASDTFCKTYNKTEIGDRTNHPRTSIRIIINTIERIFFENILGNANFFQSILNQSLGVIKIKIPKKKSTKNPVEIATKRMKSRSEKAFKFSSH